jgi:predicted nucleic acid-binding protein
MNSYLKLERGTLSCARSHLRERLFKDISVSFLTSADENQMKSSMNSEEMTMISAIDTNILLDILIPNTRYLDSSLECITRAAEDGSLVIGEMVFAELSSQFEDLDSLRLFLSETSIHLILSNEEALREAGIAWKRYMERKPSEPICPACGKSTPSQCPHCGQIIVPKRHLISDFLIGAHAKVFAGRLITRDRGFYRTYFEGLNIVDPGHDL